MGITFEVIFRELGADFSINLTFPLKAKVETDRVVDLSEFLEAAALVTWLGGPFFPLYEVFTGVLPKLEDQVVAQKKEIETNMGNLNSFFNILNHNELEQKLYQEVENLKKETDELSSKTKKIENELQKYERALEEFKKAEIFYSQFQLS